MVNVGCVARCIAEVSPKLLERFQFRSSTVGALAALHDLVKISPGFQRKCEVWLAENGLTKIARNSINRRKFFRDGDSVRVEENKS